MSFKKLLRIIGIFPRLMFAGIKACTAVDALCMVDLNARLPVHHDSLIRCQNGTDGNTPVAPNTVLIRVNIASHNSSTPLCCLLFNFNI